MVTLLVLAAALAAWPRGTAARRLRLLGNGGRPRAWPRPRPHTVLVIVAAAVPGWLALGTGGALAAALVAATAWRRRRSRRELRDTFTAVDGLVEALRSLVAELAAGAHPADAAERAAADADPAAARVLRGAAGAVRLGGDVGAALSRGGLAPALADAAHQLGRAWQLAARHGLPLADVLDAVARDLDQRSRFSRRVLARMAGPRASATVLAGLPVLGILLGEAMGAHPLAVLSDGMAGQVLLVLGVALVCAGLAWAARLTGQAVLR
ncbi:type II secretion system F family protein [Actinokineospora iranica]|uniref:Tight adherence protein B n=1 Tax=Actinokineospora iranica TaxID=1271860 RepID=A0A1G6XWJ4_9PSEU|nr:type II secretion system F family protein [Actinokineospora iranica]SDD82043.1 tight adherence protein B [Actinokineospora iranica]